MANYGIKISKSGYGVTSADQKQLLHSKYPLLKIIDSDTGTLTKAVNQNTVSVTITHNLGYIPICFVYGQYIDENGATVERYRDFNWEDTFGLHQWERYSWVASTTTLIISYTTEYFYDHEIILDYMYYICADPVN